MLPSVLTLEFIFFKCVCVCVCVWVCVCVCTPMHLVAQLCQTICGSMDCSPPGSPVHGVLQARRRAGSHFLLQGIFPGEGINLGFCIAARFFTIGATRVCWQPNGCWSWWTEERSQREKLLLFTHGDLYPASMTLLLCLCKVICLVTVCPTRHRI